MVPKKSFFLRKEGLRGLRDTGIEEKTRKRRLSLRTVNCKGKANNLFFSANPEKLLSSTVPLLSMLEADCREISKNVQDGHWSQLNKRKVHEEFEDAGPIACGDDFLIISRMECSRKQVHEEFEDADPASNCSEGNKSIVLAPFSGERVIVQALMATQNCPWRNPAKRSVKPQELMAAPKSTQRR
ncbi:hypothetical protein C5167_032331 [Papaver somniferum]|uniref:Uncharacterized protein n=1 Tax=Papaver somniferum TaxID=3469 RepID=A0A4Y7KB60_PAPSO|nr:hypothetical protein C5167_032331 [Papaver somniferum]